MKTVQSLNLTLSITLKIETKGRNLKRKKEPYGFELPNPNLTAPRAITQPTVLDGNSLQTGYKAGEQVAL